MSQSDRVSGEQIVASGKQKVSPSRASEAIALIDRWLNDGSDYDAETWPELKAALDRDRLSDRKLFDE